MTTASFFAHGKEQTATLTPIPAFEAWEIRRHLRDFVKSGEKTFRLEFARRILKFASVGGAPLVSDDVINSKLESWKNIEYVLDTVLQDNELGTIAEADYAVYDWDKAGQEIAIAFMKQAAALVGPGFDLMKRHDATKAGE